MKSLQIALLVVFAIIAAGIAFFLLSKGNGNAESLQERLALEGLSVKGIEGFTLKNDVEIAGIRTLTASGQGIELRVRVSKGLSKEGALKLVEDKKAMLLSMYGKWTVSYPGRLTREIECPQEFHPELKPVTGSDFNLLFIKALASERFSYGVCSSDAAAYNSARTFQYCDKTGNLFELEAFSKIGSGKEPEAEQIALSGKCAG